MAEYDDKGFITKLKSNEIFVFGSNLAGVHGGGAAKQAYEEFGAEWGIGEGRVGRSYAFPTLDENYKILSVDRFHQAQKSFYDYALSNPKSIFLLTKVGTGIANIPEEFMKELFKNPPDNIILPKEWQ